MIAAADISTSKTRLTASVHSGEVCSRSLISGMPPTYSMPRAPGSPAISGATRRSSAFPAHSGSTDASRRGSPVARMTSSICSSRVSLRSAALADAERNWRSGTTAFTQRTVEASERMASATRWATEECPTTSALRRERESGASTQWEIRRHDNSKQKHIRA